MTDDTGDATEMARCRALGQRHTDDFVSALLATDRRLRNQHLLLLRAVTVLTLALPVSVAFNFFQAVRPPALAVSASRSAVNGIAPLPLMGTPINTEAEVRRWVTQAVVQAYSFGFEDWNRQLGASRRNFTPAGWSGFHAAIQDQGVLQAVIDRKFRITAVPRAATVMKSLPPEGGGRRMWVFEVPIVVTYEGPSVHPSTDLMITVTVVPQPVWEQERGLGIASMTLGN